MLPHRRKDDLPTLFVPGACCSTPQHTAHPAWMRLSASHQGWGPPHTWCAHPYRHLQPSVRHSQSPLPCPLPAAMLLPHCRDVGSMDTQHHTVSVRVKSVLDSCDDEEGPDDGAMQEMKGSQQVGGGWQLKALAFCVWGEGFRCCLKS